MKLHHHTETKELPGKLFSFVWQYLKNKKLYLVSAWAHAGGVPGYESLYVFDICNGIYLVFSYSVKPKKQHITEIATDIFF